MCAVCATLAPMMALGALSSTAASRDLPRDLSWIGATFPADCWEVAGFCWRAVRCREPVPMYSRLASLLRRTSLNGVLGNRLWASRSWECYESGLETRDVLSNGERKADMEELLGRKVASREFEWEANLPAPERLRLMQERRRALQDRQRLTEG